MNEIIVGYKTIGHAYFNLIDDAFNQAIRYLNDKDIIKVWESTYHIIKEGLNHE